MVLASFIDHAWVAPGILLGFAGLIFVMSAAGVGRRRPLGIMLLAGTLLLMVLLALTDWLIDDVF